MQDFRDLKVWQRAHALVLQIYKASSRFPDHERYGLISQLRRAAVSIPANIAEGTIRASDQDFARFLQIAIGSASEVDYLLLLARDLEYANSEVTARSTGSSRTLNACSTRSFLACGRTLPKAKS
jgi:four helix bundle protein